MTDTTMQRPQKAEVRHLPGGEYHSPFSAVTITDDRGGCVTLYIRGIEAAETVTDAINDAVKPEAEAAA